MFPRSILPYQYKLFLATSMLLYSVYSIIALEETSPP